MKRLPSLCGAILATALPVLLGAESLLPGEPISLHSLSAFKRTGDNWVLASGLAGDPRRTDSLEAVPGSGTIVNVAPKTTGQHLITDWEHADIELSFEFLVPQDSNSGVYFMGRYEVQILDSWGVESPGSGDCGGIYQRWNEKEKRGYEGTAPRVNASRAPGLWQSMRVVFQAPRFDDKGNKIANARFREVEHNGFLIHQDVEVTGPTRAAKWGKEAPTGPIVIQGNHGPVAFRNITRKLLDFSNHISLENVQSQLRRNSEEGNSEDLPFEAAIPAASINPADLGVPKSFTGKFTGEFSVPTAGTYAFDADTGGTTSLKVNDQTVLFPINPGVRSVPIHLDAGSHDFELTYTQSRWGKPRLALFVEGPGIARQRLDTARSSSPAEVANLTAAMADEEAPEAKPEKRKEIIISPPTDGVRLQRGFTPFAPHKRLYSAAVGSSSGVHYAYDFDTATILRVWNGPFLDLFEFWDGRAHNQYLTPIGPALTFHDRPTIALLESGEHDWPNETDAMWQSDGYTLDERGEPTFFARLSDIAIEDRITTTSAPRSLQRSITLRGEHTSWMTGILLAEAESITAEANGLSYIIGDRSHYLDVDAGNDHQPFIRHINGRDQLILYPPKYNDEVTLTYTLVW